MPASHPPALSTGGVPAVGGLPSGRSSRVVRGAAAAVLSTAVALGSHLLAGAEVPGVLGVLVPLVFAVSVCTVLAGVRLSALRLSLSVAVSQVLFHTLFVLGTVPAGASAVVRAGHDSHAAHEGTVLVSVVGGSGGPGHAAHASVGMWLAHAGAAALTVFTLHRGERLLAQLRRLATAVLGWALPRRSAAGVPILKRQHGPVGTVPVVVRSFEVLAGSLARRGPPVPRST